MIFRRQASLLLVLLSFSGPLAADSEIDQLRAENAHLKAQLKAARQSCAAASSLPLAAVQTAIVPPQVSATSPAAATNEPAATVARESAPSPQPPEPIPSSPAPITAPTSSPPPVVAAANPAPAQISIPDGYKLVPINSPDAAAPADLLAPPYDRTGCSRGLLKGPPPASWNDATHWLELQRGFSTTEVEATLGKEHFNVAGKGRNEWQYGKCGETVGGWVQFEDGKLTLWQAPDF